MPNYKQIEKLIFDRKPFKHGDSMKAVVEDNGYVIYSYRTVIARFDFDSCEWAFDTSYYSATTSRQQSLIRRALSLSYPTTPQFEE